MDGDLLACRQLCCRRLLGHIRDIIAILVGVFGPPLVKNIAPLIGRHCRDHLCSGEVMDAVGWLVVMVITPWDARGG
jgi:hypothetical protein